MNILFETTEGGFRGKYGFLSNMYLIDIEYNGKIYPCSEIIYMMEKTIQEPDLSKVISECSDGYQAKRLSKKATIELSNTFKIGCMIKAIDAKFNNPVMQSKLLDTGEIELVEYNTWGDTFWGVCDGQGQNVLGNLLMCKRDELMRMSR